MQVAEALPLEFDARVFREVFEPMGFEIVPLCCQPEAGRFRGEVDFVEAISERTDRAWGRVPQTLVTGAGGA